MPIVGTAVRRTGSGVISPRKEENDPLGGNSPEPIKVYSERDLSREFESLLKDLRNKDHDAWLKRNAALRTIQALILGGAAEMESFLTLIKESRDPIADALGDLRSVLVKEACTTVSMLAEVLGNSIASLADAFLPVLLKQLPVTILVISEASHHCLRSFLKHVHSVRMIPRIIDGCKAKQNAVRSKSIEYLLLILHCWSTTDMEKQVESMEAALLLSLTDAQSDVRANARLCVVVFCERFEERGKRFMSGLDPSTQKKILQDGMLEAERRENPLGANKTASINIPNTALSHDDMRGGRPKSFSRESSGVGEGKASLSDKLQLGSKRVSLTTVIRSDAKETKCEDPEPCQPTCLSKGAKRVKGPGSPSSTHPPLQQSNLANIQTANASESTKSIGPAKRAPADRKAVQSDGIFETCSVEEGAGGRIASKRGSRVVSADEEVDVSGLLEKANNGLWSLRESALDELRTAVDSGVGSRSTLQQLGKVADLVGERLGDAHYRVQLASLGLVACLAQHFTASLAPHIENLITRVIQRLTDKREGVNKAAREVLTSLSAAYGLEYLVPSIIKTLEAPQPLVRSTALDYLITSMPTLLPFLQSNNSQTRILCSRLWHLSIDKALDVRKSSVHILLVFRASGIAISVYDAASKLPSDCQILIRKAMSAHLADFDRELNTYIRSRKLPGDLSLVVPLPGIPLTQPVSAAAGSPNVADVKPSHSQWGETDPAPRTLEYSEWLDEFSQPGPVGCEDSNTYIGDSSNVLKAVKAGENQLSGVSKTLPGEKYQNPTSFSGESASKGHFSSEEQRDSDPESSRIHQTSGSGTAHTRPVVAHPTQGLCRASSNSNSPQEGKASAEKNQRPQACEALLQQLVRDVLCGDSGKCRASLEALSSLAREGDELLWGDWVGEVSISCVEALRRPVEAGGGGHEAAMTCMSCMGVSMPRLLSPLVPLLVDALLATAHYGRRSLLALAEETASSLLCECNPILALEVMAKAISQAEAPVLQSALRLAARAVKVLPVDLVTHHAHELTVPMLPHMNHTDADVRKSVVFALVALYQVVGADLRQHLEPLTPSQHKLVTIYLQRSSAQNL